VAEGSITPSEAVVLTNLIDGQRKAVGGEPPPVAPAPVSISVAFVSPIHGDRIGTGQSQVILS
jgi:hypothetical protein